MRMLCKQCAYRLDGLAERRCPECGSAFNPHEPSTFKIESSEPQRISGCFIMVGLIVVFLLIMFIAGRTS